MTTRIDKDDTRPDEASFDASAKQRDYEEVGRSLPVFCISSKAVSQIYDTTIYELLHDG